MEKKQYAMKEVKKHSLSWRESVRAAGKSITFQQNQGEKTHIYMQLGSIFLSYLWLKFQTHTKVDRQNSILNAQPIKFGNNFE